MYKQQNKKTKPQAWSKDEEHMESESDMEDENLDELDEVLERLEGLADTLERVVDFFSKSLPSCSKPLDLSLPQATIGTPTPMLPPSIQAQVPISNQVFSQTSPPSQPCTMNFNL